MHRCVVQRIARGDETCLRAVCPLPCLPVCTLRDHYFAALKEDFYLVFSLSLSLSTATRLVLFLDLFGSVSAFVSIRIVPPPFGNELVITTLWPVFNDAY